MDRLLAQRPPPSPPFPPPLPVTPYGGPLAFTAQSTAPSAARSCPAPPSWTQQRCAPNAGPRRRPRPLPSPPPPLLSRLSLAWMLMRHCPAGLATSAADLSRPRAPSRSARDGEEEGWRGAISGRSEGDQGRRKGGRGFLLILPDHGCHCAQRSVLDNPSYCMHEEPY